MDGHSSSRPVTVLLLAALTSSVLGQGPPRYIEHGKPLVLTPPKYKDVISSIVWTHNTNLVVEWVNMEKEFFGSFIGRTELDESTAQLTVKDTTQSDGGEYKVEINNEPQSQVYKAAVIKKVPKPKVEVTPSCDRTSSKCTFTCQGDTAGTQPLNYSWGTDQGVWAQEQQSMDLLIFKDEKTQRVKWIYCTMKNPISEEVSSAFFNPMYSGLSPGELAASIIIPIIIIVVVLVGLGVWKRKAIKTKFCAESGPI
ncbi:uncharacterized protein LOC133020980 [Limanda limanda]|uniref:uncharacterized protein LOC133020980 n=1 Tax=Limanda limanda TaxID=27771 RepID=UPI0029C7F42C|nr:uncharacterized protein LOC133020980 [Limanda limanda]